MKNTFLNRVSAERRVLSVVNELVPRDKQLTGLSLAAIDFWLTIVKFDRASAIYPLLISLAEKCQRLSDRSNETFMPIEEAQVEMIEEQLDSLRSELQWGPSES
jgi:hypothetical protein